MKKQNFNLVEIIIAMGIVVVCITTIMGMFAVGMQTSKEAISRTYCNNIIEQIGGMIETHPDASDAVPDTEPYTTTAAASTQEDACTTAVDPDDPFFKDVYYDGTNMDTLKIIYKTKINSADVEDFTAFAKLWWDSTPRTVTTTDIAPSPREVDLDDNKILNIEVTWPHKTPYQNRILSGQVITFQKVMRP